MKKILFLIVISIISFLAIYFIFDRQNISLPYMSCGGSTPKGLSNKCFNGFSCEYPLPTFDGDGGVCKPE